jgi:hypothetical protein
MRILIAGALAPGLLAISTPLAHADANQGAYVRLVWSQGVPGTSDEILNNGYQLCYALRTTSEDINTIATLAAPKAELTIPQMGAEIGAAIRYLCPDQVVAFGRGR